MDKMSSISGDDFRLLFANNPTPCVVILADDDFTIAEVNDAFLHASRRTRESLLGLKLFDAFPDNPDADGSGVQNLRASLQRAIARGKPDTMPMQRYDIPLPKEEGGGFAKRHWSAVNTPVLSAGEVRFVLHRVEDITPLVELTAEHERDLHSKKTLEVRNREIMTELVARGEQLKAANERMQLEAERKNEFLAMLAHELRSPLAAVTNVTRLLEPAVAQNPGAQPHLQILQRQVSSLKNLVDSLLDVSRITRGLIQIDRQRVDLATVLDNAVETVQPLLAEKHHKLRTRKLQSPVCVLGDWVRLEQILVNLLTNAGRYTAPEGDIEVTLSCRGNTAELRVKDNGVGLSKEMTAQVFDMFAQGKRELARSEGGLGIGLTIVQKLAELHGGSVSAHSEGIGKGAEFIVHLPAVAAQKALPAQTRGEAPASSRHLLVVEDNADIANTMAALLQNWGHRVDVAYDGPSGFEKARSQCPEIILLDIGLPRMDGYEVAKRIRQIPQLRQTVVVALTGYGKEDDRARMLAAGFDAHFIKPVDLLRLQEFVQQVHWQEPPPSERATTNISKRNRH